MLIKRVITKLIVDDHIDKHADHIDDVLIKRLVTYLDGGRFEPTKENSGFQYFAFTVKDNNQWYKLVWLLEENSLYIGVITAFRDRRIK